MTKGEEQRRAQVKRWQMFGEGSAMKVGLICMTVTGEQTIKQPKIEGIYTFNRDIMKQNKTRINKIVCITGVQKQKEMQKNRRMFVECRIGIREFSN